MRFIGHLRCKAHQCNGIPSLMQNNPPPCFATHPSSHSVIVWDLPYFLGLNYVFLLKDVEMLTARITGCVFLGNRNVSQCKISQEMRSYQNNASFQSNMTIMFIGRGLLKKSREKTYDNEILEFWSCRLWIAHIPSGRKESQRFQRKQESTNLDSRHLTSKLCYNTFMLF